MMGASRLVQALVFRKALHSSGPDTRHYTCHLKTKQKLYNSIQPLHLVVNTETRQMGNIICIIIIGLVRTGDAFKNVRTG